VTITGTMDFIDSDGDLDFLRLRYRPCGTGDWQNFDIDLPALSGVTSGTIPFTFVVDTVSCGPVSNTAQVSVFDAQGHQSNILNAPFELLP